jgi:anti-anti-sigma regulatory factor
VHQPLLQNRLLAHLNDTGPQLIVDLTGVGFFGATGLTILVTVTKAAVAVRSGAAWSALPAGPHAACNSR